MLKEIWKDSLANFKKNWLQSITLCFIAVAFLVVTGAMLAIPNLQVLGFTFGVFVALPMLFAIMVSHYGLRKDINSFSWGNIGRYFLAYFRMPFRGAYRVMMSVMYLMIYELLFQTVFVIASLGITQGAFPEFGEALNEIVIFIGNNGVLTEEMLQQFIDANAEAITLLSYVVGGFNIIGFALVLSYSLYNSFRTYFLIEFPTANPMVANAGYRYGLIQSRGNLMKAYWGLNWPLFLLIIAGYVSGTAIFYSVGMKFEFGYAFSFMMAFGIAGLYLPFFFSNTESIFKYNINAFDPKKNNSTQDMIDSLDVQIKQYGQMMRDLERQQKEYQDMNREEEQNKEDDKVVSTQNGEDDSNNSNEQ